MQTERHPHSAMLVLPRIRVQNANAISSPLTWGFPSITAFTGLMVALARRIGPTAGLHFDGVGVVCHDFEAQVTHSGYTRSFCLTRNPVQQDGSTAAIVEEGRVHLDITLVFDVKISDELLDDRARAQCAAMLGECLAGMRIAGGSVMPALPVALRRTPKARLVLLPSDGEERSKKFQRLSRQWLPGFALVSRDDVLQSRLHTMRADAPVNATVPSVLDAWLDLSRINYRAVRKTEEDKATGEHAEVVAWVTDSRPGWLVPIPVGYAALSELHAPGSVAAARDPKLSFRFVESVYSMGQWISPHRLDDLAQLTWNPHCDPTLGLYRCVNAFKTAGLSSESLDTYPPVPFDN
jgi:CRISPR-associated protein Csy2